MHKADPFWLVIFGFVKSTPVIIDGMNDSKIKNKAIQDFRQIRVPIDCVGWWSSESTGIDQLLKMNDIDIDFGPDQKIAYL